MDRSDLTGIILAGGKSSRMGTEKGLMEFRGKQLIQYSIDLLTRFTDKILISSGNPDYLPFGLEMVPDEVSGQGPAAGLATALKRSKTSWNLAFACDLPFLEPELVDNLLKSTANCLAVIPTHNGINEPLAGLYHKDLGEHFADAVETGNLALCKILSSCNVHFMDATILQTKYPRLFTNFNTIKDVMMC